MVSPLVPFYSYGTKVQHYRLRRNDNCWVTVDDMQYFENLVKLVEVCKIICFSSQKTVTFEFKVDLISLLCHFGCKTCTWDCS